MAFQCMHNDFFTGWGQERGVTRFLRVGSRGRGAQWGWSNAWGAGASPATLEAAGEKQPLGVTAFVAVVYSIEADSYEDTPHFASV